MSSQDISLFYTKTTATNSTTQQQDNTTAGVEGDVAGQPSAKVGQAREKSGRKRKPKNDLPYTVILNITIHYFTLSMQI